MVKLNERKIRWIIQQKLGGRGTGEIALIQRVTRRRIEQLWQAYRRTGILPTLNQPGRPSKAPVSLQLEPVDKTILDSDLQLLDSLDGQVEEINLEIASIAVD